MKKYIPSEFEQKWVDQWLKEEVYKTREESMDSRLRGNDEDKSPQDDKSKPASVHDAVGTSTGKQYVLVMFPYPSGAGLHVGHVRVYTGSDVVARYFRMVGRQLLFPMGWDAFGLPAENAAIKAKTNPKELVPQYITTFKRQIQMLGFSYDWNREFATTDPNYYKWTQYLFIEFFKMGLLYKKMTSVYFCEFCKTGLAEEEVLPDGKHERCGNIITRKDLPQWIFRITAYADRLLSELDGLDWPKGILEMQRNWIGKDKGLNIQFKVEGVMDPSIREDDEKPAEKTLTVWTKYWETVFGVTFLVVAPEHAWVQSLIQTQDDTMKEVKEYVKHALSKTNEQRMQEEKDKTGVFTGYYAINPVNGEKVPVWVADYVLADVGTGAVMGVPAHDERDFAFIKKYNLPSKQVVFFDNPEVDQKVASGEMFYEGEGTLVHSKQFNGMQARGKGKKKMAEWMIEQKFAEWKINYHLRDWIFSRQRYWGEPIPMVFCRTCADNKVSYWNSDGIASSDTLLAMTNVKDKNKTAQNISKNIELIENSMYGWFPIDQNTLPLELPYLKSYEPTGTGESPLAQVPDWLSAKCPHCGGEARRETDTMPNWAGSCWYFLRFADSKNNAAPWSKEAMENMLPVDWYIGGAEHAVLHLLYSRFWVKALQDIGMVNFNEPFMRLRTVGMVIAEDHRKMSKSFGNVINPDDVVKEFGADTLRVYEMFMAPFSQQNAWSTTALQGSYRFLKRVWELYHDQYGEKQLDPSPPKADQDDKSKNKELVAELHRTIDKIAHDIPEFKFNTSVAAMMEFLNKWETAARNQHGVLSAENAKKFLQILAPFAPFMTEELWQDLFHEKNSIHISKWPAVDMKIIHHSNVNIPVQINGKVRAVITVPVSDVEEELVIREAEKHEKIRKYIEGKVYQPIYVKGKVLNFVVKS